MGQASAVAQAAARLPLACDRGTVPPPPLWLAVHALSRNRTEDGWFHAAAITGLILKPKAAARRCSAAMLR